MGSASFPSHVIIDMHLNKKFYMYQKVPLTANTLFITPNTPIPPPPPHDSTSPFQSLCYHALRFTLKDLTSIEWDEVIRDKIAPKQLVQILGRPPRDWGAQMTRTATDLLDSSALAFESWKDAVLTIKQLLAVNCTIEIIPPIQAGTEDTWVRYPSLLPRFSSPVAEAHIHFDSSFSHESRKRSRAVRSPAPRKRAIFNIHQDISQEDYETDQSPSPFGELEAFELISCPKKPTLFGLHRGACHVVPIPFAIEHERWSVRGATSCLFAATSGLVRRTSIPSSALELLVLSIPDRAVNSLGSSAPEPRQSITKDDATDEVPDKASDLDSDSDSESLAGKTEHRRSRGRFYIP